MAKIEKSAINLVKGDKIIPNAGDHPLPFYTGVVSDITLVERGVKICFVEGGYIVRSENHTFEVEV